MRKIILGAALALATVAVTGLPAGAEPMCVEFFEENFESELANHGQHIVGDYVTGIGHDGVWPIPPGDIGTTVSENGGAFLPGQSGIMKHGASPGASFCNGSNSPTAPPGRG